MTQLVPLARHSSLPELQDLVSLFKPHNIYPNTTFPELRGHDYLLLSQYFAHTLAPWGKERLRKDAREFQQNITASEGKQPSRPPRMISPQEEEQSQEVQEELKSKFARISSKFSEAYITSNFDHLDNPTDLELLVECDEESQQEEEYTEKMASQELPEILPQSSKRMVKYTSRESVNHTVEQPKANGDGAATPPIPSSSNDGAEAGPSIFRPLQQVTAPMTVAADRNEGSSWVQGKVFCLDSSMDAAERHALQAPICEGGGATIHYGDNTASIDIALSRCDIVICKRRDGALYRAVSADCHNVESKPTDQISSLHIQASERQKIIGNTDWLTRCLSTGTFVNPQLDLLHQPYPSEAIEGSEAIVSPVHSRVSTRFLLTVCVFRASDDQLDWILRSGQTKIEVHGCCIGVQLPARTIKVPDNDTDL